MPFYPENITLLLKRLISACYDSLLLFSILFIIGGIVISINHGQAVNPTFFLPIIIITAFVFFAWFWTHGGQTLGMQAWKIKLTHLEQDKLSWSVSFKRAAYMLIPLGLGSLWILFNKEGQSLQDIMAQTKISSTVNT